MNWQELQAELQKPAYSGMTDAQAAAVINALAVTKPAGIIPAYQVINATVASEWAALTAAEKQRYQTIVGAGQIDTSNANVIAAFAAMFGAGTSTRAALLALATVTVSWAQETLGGLVHAGDVGYARGLG
jgi:hypothetical protein